MFLGRIRFGGIFQASQTWPPSHQNQRPQRRARTGGGWGFKPVQRLLITFIWKEVIHDIKNHLVKKVASYFYNKVYLTISYFNIDNRTIFKCNCHSSYIYTSPRITQIIIKLV